MYDDEAYVWGAVITWVGVFLVAWIYAIATYGYLIGVGIGWLPASIVATIAAYLWPLVALVVLGFAVFVFLAVQGYI